MKTRGGTPRKPKNVRKLREYFETEISSSSQEMGGVGLRQLQPGTLFSTNPLGKIGAGPEL